MAETRSQQSDNMAFKKRQKKITIKAFECSVLLILTDKVHQAEASVHRKYKTLEEAIGEDEADGLTISVSFNLYVVILDINSVSYNLVGHEVCHAVQRIAGDREITDDETMAWLTGYLCEEVHTFINKIKHEQSNQRPKVTDLQGGSNRPDPSREDGYEKVRYDC